MLQTDDRFHIILYTHADTRNSNCQHVGTCVMYMCSKLDPLNVLAVYAGDEKRYNIICVPPIYRYRYVQFNVILLSVAIENCPSAYIHTYWHRTAKWYIYQSTGARIYIYIMKRPSSRRRRTFSSRIRQTARKRQYQFATL